MSIATVVLRSYSVIYAFPYVSIDGVDDFILMQGGGVPAAALWTLDRGGEDGAAPFEGHSREFVTACVTLEGSHSYKHDRNLFIILLLPLHSIIEIVLNARC